MDLGTVERAYQLAPECKTINELRAKLKREGHESVDQHLHGSLRGELTRLLKGFSGKQPGPVRKVGDDSANPLPDDWTGQECEGGGDAGRV